MYVVNSLLFSSLLGTTYIYTCYLAIGQQLKPPCEPEVTLGTFQIKKDPVQHRN